MNRMKCIWVTLFLLVSSISGLQAQALGDVLVGRWELINVKEKEKEVTSKHQANDFKWLEFHQDGNFYQGDNENMSQAGTYSLNDLDQRTELLLSTALGQTAKEVWVSEGLLFIKDLEYPKKGNYLITYRSVAISP